MRIKRACHNLNTETKTENVQHFCVLFPMQIGILHQTNQQVLCDMFDDLSRLI